MNLKDSVIDITPHVLIEGPRWADAAFYGRWLLAAAKAQALWDEAMKDPDFKKQIEALTCIVIPDFGIGATVMLSQLEETLASITIGLNDAGGMAFNEFAMMVEMGFFVLTGERYQMVVPTALDGETIKMAALKLARTEDEEGIICPEYLVTTMPYARAQEWQVRLRDMDEDHRLIHRGLLLGGKQNSGSITPVVSPT